MALACSRHSASDNSAEDAAGAVVATAGWAVVALLSPFEDEPQPAASKMRRASGEGGEKMVGVVGTLQ